MFKAVEYAIDYEMDNVRVRYEDGAEIAIPRTAVKKLFDGSLRFIKDHPSQRFLLFAETYRRGREEIRFGAEFTKLYYAERARALAARNA